MAGVVGVQIEVIQVGVVEGQGQGLEQVLVPVCTCTCTCTLLSTTSELSMCVGTNSCDIWARGHQLADQVCVLYLQML